MMWSVKVVEYVDITAPRDEVFDAIINCERRLQLSPLWGIVRTESISADFPAAGSSWCSRPAHGEGAAYTTTVTDYLRGQRFAYRTVADNESSIAWSFQTIPSGTRVIYQEEFSAAAGGGQELSTQVRQVVRAWLLNIKRYAELRNGWLERLLHWLADRYYLKLRPDQRSVIATILVMQGIGAIASVMAIVAYGFTRLF